VPTRAVSERPPAERTVSAEEVAQPSREAVAQAAKHIESFVKSVGRSLDFSVDSSTGQSVLRVMNPESGELIRQLPAEETLRVAAAVDYMQSVLVNQRA
jgi:flagellar protein FlaG